MFTLAYFLRYLDIFFDFVSWYNTLAKVFICIMTLATIPEDKAIGKQFLIGVFAATILTLYCHRGGTTEDCVTDWWDYVWSFSWWLEALASIPQTLKMHEDVRFILRGSRKVITCRLVYKVAYLSNWVWRYVTGQTFVMVQFVAGLTQVALYADYIFYDLINN